MDCYEPASDNRCLCHAHSKCSVNSHSLPSSLPASAGSPPGLTPGAQSLAGPPPQCPLGPVTSMPPALSGLLTSGPGGPKRTGAESHPPAPPAPDQGAPEEGHASLCRQVPLSGKADSAWVRAAAGRRKELVHISGSPGCRGQHEARWGHSVSHERQQDAWPSPRSPG